jgi:hypothetical protein
LLYKNLIAKTNDNHSDINASPKLDY